MASASAWEFSWRCLVVGTIAVFTGAGWWMAGRLGSLTYLWLKRAWIGQSPLRALAVSVVAFTASVALFTCWFTWLVTR